MYVAPSVKTFDGVPVILPLLVTDVLKVKFVLVLKSVAAFDIPALEIEKVTLAMSGFNLLTSRNTSSVETAVVKAVLFAVRVIGSGAVLLVGIPAAVPE